MKPFLIKLCLTFVIGWAMFAAYDAVAGADATPIVSDQITPNQIDCILVAYDGKTDGREGFRVADQLTRKYKERVITYPGSNPRGQFQEGSIPRGVKRAALGSA